LKLEEAASMLRIFLLTEKLKKCSDCVSTGFEVMVFFLNIHYQTLANHIPSNWKPWGRGKSPALVCVWPFANDAALILALLLWVWAQAVISTLWSGINRVSLPDLIATLLWFHFIYTKKKM